MPLLVFSYMADIVLGDPEWFPHPVRGMGKLITIFDNLLRGRGAKWIERTKGIILVVAVVALSVYFAHLFIWLFRKFNPFLGSLVWIYLGYTALSIKDLAVKAKKILKEVKKGTIVEARKQLSKIVGRDTQDLNEEKIIVATVESIAENTNDGIVAPLFYLILGGPILAIAYKAVNTLDSMVGYKNERYINFGWFSAKLDGVMNFIPARITGFLIPISSLILRQDFKDSFKLMRRDGRKHPSPNSGISEAAMAGALGLRLGGASFYQGRVQEKPYLGEAKRQPEPSCINKALRISFMTSFLMALAGAILRWVI